MKLVYQDFLDIARGGTVLGTGGGGSYETAEILAEKVLRKKTVRLVHPRSLRGSAKAIAIAGMGSPEAMLKTPFSTEARNAFDAFLRDRADGIAHILPIETSGFNFLTPMTVASNRPVTVVDADGAGRAIPQLNLTLFYAHGIPLSPMALADANGRSVIIRGTEYALSEKLAISALESFGWSAGLACYPMNGQQAKRASVPGTISLARKVGQVLRGAGPEKDPLQAVLAVVGGFELIRGIVDRFDSETSGSYKFGVLEVAGRGAHKGARVRVNSMNENMLAWKGERPVAIAPDRICFLRSDGEPITNADIKTGEELSVFVVEAQPQWRTGQAAGLFAGVLGNMGYSGGYVPASQLRAA